MRKPKNFKRLKQEQPETYIAEPLETELEKAFESKAPIEATSAALFEEEGTEEYGVIPGTDIRQDKFEVMQKHIAEAERVGAEARAKAAEDRNKERAEDKNITPSETNK